MPVGNRFFKAPPPSNTRSITLPDGQQFIGDKLINITQSAAVLTINMFQLAAPITYTADNAIAASLVFQAIISAVTSASNADVTITEPGVVLAGVTITSVTPGSIGTLTANIAEPVVISGSGFSTLSDPIQVIVAYPGGGNGPVWNNFEDIVVVDDSTINCNSIPLTAGTWPLLLAGPDWAANIDVTVA